jgi:hypothetical protein
MPCEGQTAFYTQLTFAKEYGKLKFLTIFKISPFDAANYFNNSI